LKALNQASIKKIAELAAQSSENDNALKGCANTARAWVKGMGQAIDLTQSAILRSRDGLENELQTHPEYTTWKAKYVQFTQEQTTVKRVEKAMLELSKDNSIIDRSELDQRMVGLKQGLFGSKKMVNIQEPPVLLWIEHQKEVHDQAISGFITKMKYISDNAWGMTKSANYQTLKLSASGYPQPDWNQATVDAKVKTTLATLNLTQLNAGSREWELVCQALESTWLDWSAAFDHLGSIQFYCDLIDPVLDIQVDPRIMSSCRGTIDFNGRQLKPSLVMNAKSTLYSKGYDKQANLISAKMKALQCPVPSASVMNP
jgi:hypothetical protein